MKKYLESNRWFILACSILVMSCMMFPSVWSVFLADATETYGLSITDAATIMPMCSAFMGIFSIVGGRLQDKFSPRLVAIAGICLFTTGIFMLSRLGKVESVTTLYLSFCMPFGLGCGLTSPVLTTTTMKWFADKRGFVVGVRGASTSVFLMLFTFVSKYMLTNFGIKRTFFIMGCVFFTVSIISVVAFVNPDDEYIRAKSAISMRNMRGKNADGTVKEYVQVDFTPSEMIRTKQFWLLFLAGTFGAPLFMLVAPVIVNFGIKRGLSENLAVATVAISTGVAAIGKFILPTLSDKIGRKKCTVTFGIISLICAVILMFSSGIGVLIFYCLMYLTYTGWSMVISPLATDMFGTKNAGANMGILMIHGTITALGSSMVLRFLAPVIGELAPNIIGIVSMVLGIIFMSLIDTDTSKIKKRQKAK